MELNLKNGIIAVLVLVGLGYGVGRYLQPAKIETVTKEVIKEVEVTKKDVITVIEETKDKDGNIKKTTTITDKTVVNKAKEETKDSKTVVINQKPQWRVNASAGYDFKEKEPQYGLGFEKRYMGPLSLGLSATVNSSMTFKAANVTASWEF